MFVVSLPTWAFEDVLRIKIILLFYLLPLEPFHAEYFFMITYVCNSLLPLYKSYRNLRTGESSTKVQNVNYSIPRKHPQGHTKVSNILYFVHTTIKITHK